MDKEFRITCSVFHQHYTYIGQNVTRTKAKINTVNKNVLTSLTSLFPYRANAY